MEAEIYYLIKYLETCRYSERTIKLYIYQVQKFLDCFNKKPQFISENEIRDYMYQQVFQYNRSSSYQNLLISSLKTFYRNVVKKPLNDEIFIRPRKSNHLPSVLSREEIKAILNSIANLKHKAIISTIYGCGLRIGELINLRIKDIDSRRMVIYIRQAKGKKDRTIPLTPKLLDLLRIYWKEYKPKLYLFEGKDYKPYTRESTAKILARAIKKNNIIKK
jgi:integrase/recombinase XerD